MRPRLLTVVLMLMMVLPSSVALSQDSAEKETWTLIDLGWFVRTRPGLVNSYWLVEPNTGRIVGWTVWDQFQRRYNLFRMDGRYGGFMQATVLVPEPYSFHRQYLVYDENNDYRGISIRALGGHSTQHIHTDPYNVLTLDPPAVPKPELRGELRFYPLANTPLAVSDYRVRFFPWDIEEILDQMELPSVTGR